MYISKVRVQNYKSFRDSGEINFKPGINIIVGQNNSGKTALLEAFELKVKQEVHESEITKPTIYSLGNPNNSKVLSTIVFKAEEVIENLQLPYFSQFHILDSPSTEKTPIFSVNEFQKNIGNELSLNLIDTRCVDLFFGNYSEKFEARATGLKVIYLQRGQNNDYTVIDRGQNPIPNLKDKFGDFILKNIYRFYAERINIGRSPIGTNRKLNPDGSNLAEVLNTLFNSNPALYQEFVDLVNKVIPSVKGISSVMVETGEMKALNYEIRIWTTSPSKQREDLTIKLSNCGTGVSQVLAILYVVVSSKQPKVIIIDEPNSFLHPGAAKKLIQILNKFPQHQYFISTHSPEIISAAKPSTITRLKYEEGETFVESLDLTQTKELRETMHEIGVRFADVFFAENILWVEGPTEAQAFPLILETAEILSDVTILPLVNTGDLINKKQGRQHARLVFEIYNRLSGAHALAPPFVGVILDKEDTEEHEIRELKRISNDKVEFIPRRMYENYLLDAGAIADVFNSELENGSLTVEEIENWILDKQTQREFLSASIKRRKSFSQEDWLENVDGAKLLEKLFSELSEKTVEYRKTTHSVKLTQWLLENKPDSLAELKSFLIEILTKE